MPNYLSFIPVSHAVEWWSVFVSDTVSHRKVEVSLLKAALSWLLCRGSLLFINCVYYGGSCPSSPTSSVMCLQDVLPVPVLCLFLHPLQTQMPAVWQVTQLCLASALILLSNLNSAWGSNIFSGVTVNLEWIQVFVVLKVFSVALFFGGTFTLPVITACGLNQVLSEDALPG